MSRIKTLIIGLLLVLLGPALTGCSALRLGYANGPQLGWWWVDGYFDFDREHAPQVKRALDDWFGWHRGTQLPEYAALLASARQQIGEPTTADAACRWQQRVREQLEPALGRAITDFAAVVPGLGEAQYRHLERRYLKVNDEMRADFLQPDAAERRRASVERAVERAERVYGRLDEPQRRVITAGVEASPFSPELWLAERQRRQRDVVQTLRRLSAERADADQRVAALRALVQRTERSPNPEYRAYQTRLATYNCALAAQIHNATTPAQRQKARETIKGWEDDIRSLLVPRQGSGAAAEGG